MVCASLFCEKPTTPRMVGSRPRGGRRGRGSRRRLRRGRFGQERRSQEDHAHNELLECVESLIATHLVTREALVHALLPTVLCGLDPSFIPAIMTDLGAQS